MGPVRGVSLATLLALLFAASTAAARKQGAGWDGKIKMSTSEEEEAPADSASGVRWAVLLAGSSGYGNYRHQVCSKSSSTDIRYCLSFSLVWMLASSSKSGHVSLSMVLALIPVCLASLSRVQLASLKWMKKLSSGELFHVLSSFNSDVGLCVFFCLWQADVCHAYQILRKGGLKDENIVVFMYDDIAHNIQNPYPGTIVNHPQGSDVYYGVPKVRSTHSSYQIYYDQSLQLFRLPSFWIFLMLPWFTPSGGKEPKTPHTLLTPPPSSPPKEEKY